MDYEVLILGRVRETWLQTHDLRASVIEGVGRTGGLVTSAALVMVLVFSAFGASPLLFVKALGLGIALAVVLDATLVRLLLVPSTLMLLGRANWWLPGWMGARAAPATREPRAARRAEWWRPLDWWPRR
jgi:RND superfamily putative drug exporter